LSATHETLIYLDTNVYSRPFDDQTQPAIQAEANAFLEIVEAVKNERLILLGSDILIFEVYNILSEEKRSKVQDYLGLYTRQIADSEEILNLGQQIQGNCEIRARDALHIAAAILGQARYFLSCDKKVTQMKQGRCYRRLAQTHRQAYFSVMNPILFVEKMKQGTLE
jgi:predicted nucleic acid-binding protein